MSMLKSLSFIFLPLVAMFGSGCSQTMGLGQLTPSLGGSLAKLSPPASLAQPKSACTWQEIRGAGLSIQGYQCPQSKIMGDENLPGLVQVFESEGKKELLSTHSNF